MDTAVLVSQRDTKALHWLGNYYDQEFKTIKAAIEVNDNQKLKLLKKARQYYPSLEGLQVAVLGLAFKPGTNDLREAPSIVNVGSFWMTAHLLELMIR